MPNDGSTILPPSGMNVTDAIMAKLDKLGQSDAEIKGALSTLSTQVVQLTSRVDANEQLSTRALDQSQKALQASSDTQASQRETTLALQRHVETMASTAKAITSQNEAQSQVLAKQSETLSAQNDVLDWIRVHQTRILAAAVVLGQALSVAVQSYLRARGH